MRNVKVGLVQFDVAQDFLPNHVASCSLHESYCLPVQVCSIASGKQRHSLSYCCWIWVGLYRVLHVRLDTGGKTKMNWALAMAANNGWCI
mmetsp:Transcript_14085/g.27826  ORF Transcript_14085/g.27826 Transcript_14085/m.27826 type:complete len:90 (+) Transcript_14085:1171-1440(+)